MWQFFKVVGGKIHFISGSLICGLRKYVAFVRAWGCVRVGMYGMYGRLRSVSRLVSSCSVHVFYKISSSTLIYIAVIPEKSARTDSKQVCVKQVSRYLCAERHVKCKHARQEQAPAEALDGLTCVNLSIRMRPVRCCRKLTLNELGFFFVLCRKEMSI